MSRSDCSRNFSPAAFLVDAARAAEIIAWALFNVRTGHTLRAFHCWSFDTKQTGHGKPLFTPRIAVALILYTAI